MNNQPQQQQQALLFRSMVILHGETANFHLERFQAKLQKCPHDCGFDIFPQRVVDVCRFPTNQTMFTVGTQLYYTPSPGAYGFLTDRSSSIDKLAGGMIAPGKIDAGYTGEILVRVVCPTDNVWQHVQDAIHVCIKDKLAIAQMIVHLFCYPMFMIGKPGGVMVPFSGRGSAGFGSTDNLIKP